MQRIYQNKFISWKKSSIFQAGRNLRNEFIKRIINNRQKRILRSSIKNFPENQIVSFKSDVCRYLEKLTGGQIGRYYYSGRGRTTILYASIYGALLYDLFNRIGELSQFERKEWVDYINSFQCDDGLYRDPQIDNEIAESIDWWGWRHLSAHVITALTTLGGKTRHPFTFLNPLYGNGRAYCWIKGLPWQENCTNVSNTVMNYGVMLQYERDYRQNEQAETALIEIYSFLDENINCTTGLWNQSPLRNSFDLSEAVQTSYHLWNLYFYDQRCIPYLEQAIDSCLATQNELGGFGSQCNSSACEDIDSIDPLCRMYFLINYRRSDIELCLKRALKWILINQMTDGGFVFRRFEGFKYGHELMETDPEESNLFATWFRTLSVAYICQVLDLPIPTSDLRLKLPGPGYQFWNSKFQ